MNTRIPPYVSHLLRQTGYDDGEGDASAGRFPGDPGMNRVLTGLTEGRAQMGTPEHMSAEVFQHLSSR